MSEHFSYLIDKIKESSFVDKPFPHVEIRDFLAPEDFQRIVQSSQINTTGASDTEGLLGQLDDEGYELITFPGTIASKSEYLKWIDGRSKRTVNAHTTGFGIVFRLADCRDPLVRDLDAFFRSAALKDVLIEKFGLTADIINCLSRTLR